MIISSLYDRVGELGTGATYEEANSSSS